MLRLLLSNSGFKRQLNNFSGGGREVVWQRGKKGNKLCSFHLAIHKFHSYMIPKTPLTRHQNYCFRSLKYLTIWVILKSHEWHLSIFVMMEEWKSAITAMALKTLIRENYRTKWNAIQINRPVKISTYTMRLLWIGICLSQDCCRPISANSPVLGNCAKLCK